MSGPYRDTGGFVPQQVAIVVQPKPLVNKSPVVSLDIDNLIDALNSRLPGRLSAAPDEIGPNIIVSYTNRVKGLLRSAHASVSHMSMLDECNEALASAIRSVVKFVDGDRE